MTLNRCTVIQMARRVCPLLERRRRAENSEVSLRRFSRRELQSGIREEVSGAGVRIRPVFVFPKSVAGLERLAARVGALGGLSLPLAMDLLMVIKLPSKM